MNSRPTLQYALLAIVFAITMVFFAHHLWYMGQLLREHVSATTPSLHLDFDSAKITSVEPEAQAAGIRNGDTLLAIDGVPYRNFPQYVRAREYAQAGDLLTLTVRHDNAAMPRDQTVRVPLVNRKSAANSIWVAFALGILLPTSCLLLGFGVAALRPRDLLAWLLLGLMLGYYNFITIGAEFLNATPFAWVAIAFQQLAAQAWFIWIFLLGIYFPARLGLERRFSWLKWFVIAPLAVRGIIQIVAYEGLLGDYNFGNRMPHLWQVINNAISGPGTLFAIGSFFVLIAVKYFTAKNQDARRRLRLLYVGTFFAIVPMLALIIAAGIKGKVIDQFPPWIELPALFLMLLLPATLAYLIIVHKAMDVRVVIRQGLQYALARRGVIVLQGALTAALAIVIATYISHHHLTQPQIFGVIALAVFLSVRLRKLMARLALWIDRRFFREAYNTELLLAELSENVRSIVETRPLLETVASRIAQALHVPQIAVLLPASGPFQPAYTLGYDSPSLNLAFPEGGATQHLRQSKAASRVYLDDPNNWVNNEPTVTTEERERLAQLNAELLLPLIVKDRMLGFISLSQKRSEEAYSGTDLYLLNSVASQTALALENSRLTGEIAQEVAQRERLNREIEIAREVQEHLLPQSLPAISGVDIAGSFRPAQGVGGDYYDFLELADGKLGIAIGDVSGKGVSAALVMANLQASLRSQSLITPNGAGGDDHLAVIITRINRLIYQSSASSRYATFFFAEYDPSSRTLTYVNAGHNAPMLFRAAASNSRGPAFGPKQDALAQDFSPASSTSLATTPTIPNSEIIERLEAGGPVIGLLPHCEYVQKMLILNPGDILLAYTDGVSETMNHAEEEWGEDALIQTIQQYRNLDAKELLAQIMRVADIFASGAQQFDDMTMLTLRVL